MAALAAVGAVVAPVVDHVVAEVHIPAAGGILVILIDVRMVDAGVAAVVMGQDVMMERGVLAAPETAITVVPLRMQLAVLHGFRNQAPLEGEVLVSVERGGLVDAPAHGAVVQDHVVQVAAPDAVFAIGLAGLDLRRGPRGFVAQAETDETDDDIGSLQVHRIVLEADPVARGRLARDRQVALGNLEVGLQLDDAGHVEDDGAGAGLVHGPAEGSLRTGVLQRGHVIDLAAAAAGGVHAAALGAREGAGDAILLHGRDGEIGIELVGRRGGRIGIDGPVRTGVDPGHGGRAAGVHSLHAEPVVRRFRQAGDGGIAGAGRSLLHFCAVFLEFPGVGSRPFHRVPLELQAGFRRLVQFQVCRSRRGLGGVRHDNGILLPAAGGQKQGCQGQQGQFFLHSFSYSREAQMKGPTPFGSFSTIFSLI